MRWEGGRRSTNIEDRRGLGLGTVGGGGIGMLLIVLAVSSLTGTNPLTLLQVVEQANPGQTQSVPTGAPSGDPAAEFVSVVLGDTEETWDRVFQAAGKRYNAPVRGDLTVGIEGVVAWPGRQAGAPDTWAGESERPR